VEFSILVFLAGGLFLGWALGANDAANVFGTAVGTRMIDFVTAATVCSIFVILGAVISGAGTTETLGKLGTITALPGAFSAAVSAAITVYIMTRWGLPVSTSQAIVGAIVGWNVYSGSATDLGTLTTIVSTWFFCPLLSGLLAAILLPIISWILRKTKPHLLRLDQATRWALLLAGAFGAYSLGANNIANVMGVFVPTSPFGTVQLGPLLTLNPMQLLFLLGGLAIATGVFTYSRRVMMTVGNDLFQLSPAAAWVVVVSHSIVLFVFASTGLSGLLAGAGLPQIPLVPVSSSQAVIGAILGIGLLKGGAGIRWRVLGGIGIGWVVTPVCAGLICLVFLFVLQNVFGQVVYL
jgi:PiT family inorganic phosphate transporter